MVSAICGIQLGMKFVEVSKWFCVYIVSQRIKNNNNKIIGYICHTYCYSSEDSVDARRTVIEPDELFPVSQRESDSPNLPPEYLKCLLSFIYMSAVLFGTSVVMVTTFKYYKFRL